jgi:hypothetical protein
VTVKPWVTVNHFRGGRGRGGGAVE